MNERIKELRKTLGLSGEKFGEKIGLSKFAISNIEMGKNNLTEQTLLSIVREYNVNENWLRNGTGEMFTPNDKIPLDELTKDADPLEKQILKAYFTLDKEIRQKAIEHFKESLKPTNK